MSLEVKSIVLWTCYVALQEEVDLLPNLQRLFLSFNCITRYGHWRDAVAKHYNTGNPFSRIKDALELQMTEGNDHKLPIYTIFLKYLNPVKVKSAYEPIVAHQVGAYPRFL